MAGLLVAAACWAWMEGMRQRKLPYFAVMYLLTGLTFHVRPFTALLTAATLTGCLACSLRRARGLLIRVLATGAVLGIATVGSLLLYNKAFTGSIWLSPYALLKGVSIPLEISASLPEAVHNINVMWRFGGQSTVVYFFPLIFFLAGLGFWKNRSTSPVVWLLLSLFVVTVLGHLVQTESSGSVVAERYWFEAYFAIAILGAQGIVAVTTALQSSHRPLIAATCTLLAIQTIITFCAIKIILRRSAPFIAVAHLAAQYENCLCVVFLKSSPPVFFGQHMNLNGPDWPRAKVFYAIDPGPELRMSWTRTLGRDRFVVVSYDQVRGEAEQNE
jgi:4-amino-4-deoxy-L-arabinose transferase-like glycosyltransferase